MAEPEELKAFQDLYEELSQSAEKTPQYTQFLDKLDQLNGKMSAMYQPDKYGRIPLVTEADRAELLKLHEELGVMAEQVLAEPGEMRKEQLDTVKRLNGLNNTYRSAMRSYDPADKKALHTIHEEMRTPVIDTRNTKLKAQLGGAVSKRQPLTFLDPSGKEISGVFIPEKKENGVETIVEALNTASKTAVGKAGKNLFKNMLDHFRELHEDEEDKSLLRTITLMGSRLQVRGTNPPKFTAKSIADYISQHMDRELGGGSVQEQIGAETLQALADTLNKNFQGSMMNRSEAQIEPGSRVDTRNAAMSSVAALLGVPNIIARSTPMQIIDANGNKVNGTFMMEAKGMDPENLPPEAEKVTLDAANKTDGKAFKDVADLQVLDYICGNVDRHAANFFLKFDKKGKISGVQGIDNDCSCGKRVPAFGEGYNRLVSVRDLRVMSESMYQKIRDMTPAQLKFSLRGYGLSEKEMDAACVRLRHIQAMVKKYAITGTKKPKKIRYSSCPTTSSRT